MVQSTPRWLSISKLKLPSAALIAAGMFATPALARTSRVTSQRRFATARYIDGRIGISAPRVGAFPPVPADEGNCDVGDNPRIC
jgi:hypothetical protein